MPALYQKGPLFFCWLGTRQIPTLGKENLHQRKFEPATSTVENPPSTSGPKPYRRKATSARYTTVLVLGVGIPRPKNWSGTARKTLRGAQKNHLQGLKKGWKQRQMTKSKQMQQQKGTEKTTLVNIDVPVVCPCVSVCAFACQCPHAFASCMFHIICTRENFGTSRCNIKKLQRKNSNS